MTGAELKAAREAAKLTQKQLGLLLGMRHWRNVSHLEEPGRTLSPGMEARIKLALIKAGNRRRVS
jgi:transcriptional regulator with XRE-family HTH domain